jgi:hypothetical protein
MPVLHARRGPDNIARVHLPLLAVFFLKPAVGEGSSDALYSDCHRTWPIKNRDVTRRSAEQDDPGLRNAAVTIVNDKMIGAPESQCTGREIELPLDRGHGRGQMAGLFLTQVVAHFDCERQHLDQRSGRFVVDQLGIDLAPLRGN